MQKRQKERFHEYFENAATDYPKYRKKFNYYWKDIISYCNYFIDKTDTILEIGCGTGDTLAQINGSKKTGIDFSTKMIEQAKLNYKSIDFRVSEAENIELDQTFDVILLSNVIGYFDNVSDVFNEIKKLCHPRTRIVITYYNYLWEPILWFAEFLGIKKKSRRQNWLSIKDIQNLLYHSDFETYRTAKRTLLPINIPLISYLVNKYTARLPFFNAFALNHFVFARPVFCDFPKEEYSVSVVIPARNESGNIEAAILRTPMMGKHTEIIFIEGNSTDDTWDKVQAIQKKYASTHDIKIMQQDGKGKGDAVRKAYAAASGDILMILDADLTVPPEDLPKFYDAIARRKGEFINGSRLVYPMHKNAMRPLNTVGNHFFSKVFTWILEQPIKDTLCGTKVMFRKDYEKLAANRSFFGNFDPFGDFDLIFGAYKLNLKIIDLPIRYQERTYGDTNISRFRHGLLLLKMVIFAAGKIKFW